jgi:hypothetical protein
MMFWQMFIKKFQLLAVHDCFKRAAGHDIFLLDWRQVLSYNVSFLNIRLIVSSVINLVSKLHPFSIYTTKSRCSINHGCSTKAPRTNPFEALPSPARI